MKEKSFSRPPSFLQLFETSIFHFDARVEFVTGFRDMGVLNFKTAVSRKRLKNRSDPQNENCSARKVEDKKVASKMTNLFPFPR